jgi:molecular chaperone HscA
MLREQQVEADRVVEALDAAMAVDGDALLSEQEQRDISAARSHLLAVKSADDEDAIKQAIQQLEKVCDDYVARRMNSSIKQAMQGHNVNEYESESDAE